MSGNRLKEKVALITGAAQGIGKGIATIFAKEGAIVIITDVDDDRGISLVRKIGTKAVYFHLDVALEKDWEKVIASSIERFGKLDILVNNAGITGFQEGFGPQDPENISLEDWRAVHAVNSDGVFLGCKYAIQAMKNSENGSIVNISSRSGIVGIPGAAAYASSKAAVRNHTKTVALYACEKGYPIRCNSIHPATILTSIWEPMLGSGADRQKNLQAISKGVPMKKMGVPEDVAYAALYLASDEARYVTGIEINVDGGLLAGTGAAPQKQD